MNDTLYRQMQERLDTFSVGFPATESGIEIDILKYLFTEKDAEMFMALSQRLTPAAEIAKQIEKPEEETEALLESMTERGLIFRVKKNGTGKYGTIAFVHGICEFQIKFMTPEFAKMLGQYFDEAFDEAMQKSAEYFLRVIPVNQSIEATQNIASYNDAVAILKSKDRIVVADCVCRKRADAVDEWCGKEMEACFMFGSMGQYYLDNEMGREVSLDEAVKIIEKCQEEGMVTQPATMQNPSGMCNCCGDCCGVLRALKMDPEPARHVFSNHIISADTEACIGCEACLDRCQMEALSLDDNEQISVAMHRCIGCGLCVTTCPTEALSLVEKPEKEFRLPPENMMEQMGLMAQKRGLL